MIQELWFRIFPGNPKDQIIRKVISLPLSSWNQSVMIGKYIVYKNKKIESVNIVLTPNGRTWLSVEGEPMIHNKISELREQIEEFQWEKRLENIMKQI